MQLNLPITFNLIATYNRKTARFFIILLTLLTIKNGSYWQNQLRTQKGIICMENNNGANNTPNMGAQIMGKYRPIAKQYGRYFGEQLYTIIAVNPDLKWKEDTIAGKNTLRQEVRALLVKPIDVLSVELLEKDFDGQPKIIMNGKDKDKNLVFPLVPPEFSKATRENVADAIDRLSKNNSKPVFFSAEDLPQLNEFLDMHNQAVLSFFEDQSRHFMQLSETVRGYMDAGTRLKNEYLRQCGVQLDSTIEAHVKVEIDE